MKTLILGNKGLRLNACIESMMLFYNRDAEHEVILDTPDIRDNILDELQTNDPHVLFLRDHDVFTRHFYPSIAECLNNGGVASVCLSLGLNTDYSYQLDKFVEPPKGTIFPTRMYAGEFNNPMGLDGYIYRTSDIEALISQLQFDSVAELHWCLSKNRIEKEYCVVGVLPCVAGIISIQEDKVFAEQQKKGKKINIEPMFELPQNSMFVRYDYTFKWAR